MRHSFWVFFAVFQTYGQYWPEEHEECECGPFVIEIVSISRPIPDVVLRKLKLCYNSNVSLPVTCELLKCQGKILSKGFDCWRLCVAEILLSAGLLDRAQGLGAGLSLFGCRVPMYVAFVWSVAVAFIYSDYYLGISAERFFFDARRRAANNQPYPVDKLEQRRLSPAFSTFAGIVDWPRGTVTEKSWKQSGCNTLPVSDANLIFFWLDFVWCGNISWLHCFWLMWDRSCPLWLSLLWSIFLAGKS